jgi:hypothetical protein
MNNHILGLLVEQCILMFEKWMEIKNGSKMDGGQNAHRKQNTDK